MILETGKMFMHFDEERKEVVLEVRGLSEGPFAIRIRDEDFDKIGSGNELPILVDTNSEMIEICSDPVSAFDSDIEVVPMDEINRGFSMADFNPDEFQPMSSEQREQHFKNHFKKLPPHFVEDVVLYLRDNISKEQLREFRNMAIDDIDWMIQNHLSVGVDVRNLLRKGGWQDRNLPSGNWDDYFAFMIDIASGFRDKNGDPMYVRKLPNATTENIQDKF
jgi:hypothetical protein